MITPTPPEQLEQELRTVAIERLRRRLEDFASDMLYVRMHLDERVWVMNDRQPMVAHLATIDPQAVAQALHTPMRETEAYPGQHTPIDHLRAARALLDTLAEQIDDWLAFAEQIRQEA